MQYDEKIEGAEITEIKVCQVHANQAPDFVDAYVESCLVDGIPASEYALEYIAERMPWVAQEAAMGFCVASPIKILEDND